MYNVTLVDDFSLAESKGGAEFVNDTVVSYLNCDWEKSAMLEPDKSKFYIISNISQMHPCVVKELSDNHNYVILEHDYKICDSRHPWRYKDCIVPKEERVNYDLYKNAKKVFVQTQDHLDVMKANDVEADFHNLDCSIWSDTEIQELHEFRECDPIRKEFFILDSPNWIKGTKGAIDFCKHNKFVYHAIPQQENRRELLAVLSEYATLVFFPIARETCCRFIVEAKCMGMNVITSMNSGAWFSDWYTKGPIALLEHLEKQSKINLIAIKDAVS